VSTAAHGAGFVQWFRRSAPYINAHRGRTFVISVGGEAVLEPGFANLIHDLALLHSLGVRIVLVVGTRPQITARMRDRGIEEQYHRGVRITCLAALDCVKEAAGVVRVEVEALLSMGLANSPMAGFRLRVASGNFVTARPLGVQDGVDYQHTGEVRRFDHQAVSRRLDDESIVLLVPLGYSPTGEAFNLTAEDVALSAAQALKADKLIYLLEHALPRDAGGGLLREISVARLERLLAAAPSVRVDAEAVGVAVDDQCAGAPSQSAEALRLLNDALMACRAGVARVHLLERRADGQLLLELFTRDGVGTLIAGDPFESIRRASIDDVGGILALTEPLERAGVLVRRSRELLENQIDQFQVIERDGTIIASAALAAWPGATLGELACFATHPDYVGGGRGGRLLKHVEQEARRRGLEGLFVLTTRASHWFRERGFEPGRVSDLPPERQSLYNTERRSKVFIKRLVAPAGEHGRRGESRGEARS